MKIERYQVYKDSGIDWLWKIPEHWKVTHIKRTCKKVTDGAHTSPDISSEDYPFLTVVNLKNGILDFDNCLHTSAADYQKLVRNGCKPKLFDVLYSKDGTISESIPICENQEFVVGSSFIILTPKYKRINSNYLSYLLSSFIMRFQASIYVKGASLPRISIFNVAKLFCVVPPLPEQKTIANYLDTKTAQIDRKIDLLTQKATLYGNLKQSLINETVTRGLDKSVPMKDSRIEWLGEIPEHWEVKRVKELSTIISKGTTPSTEGFAFVDEGIRFIKAENINNTKIISKFPNFYISEEANEALSRSKLKLKDILIVIAGATIGKIGIVDEELLPANTNQAVCFVRFKKCVDIDYYYYLLVSDYFSKYVWYSIVQSAQPNLSMGVLSKFLLFIPGTSEQKAIANYLDTKTAQIDQIIQTINSQIEKLKEFRKTLINDVVTGKIKV